MSTSGLSKVRLARMHAVMAGYVERGEMPGLVPGFLDSHSWGFGVSIKRNDYTQNNPFRI